MNAERIELFKRLAPVGGLSVVQNRRGEEFFIVNDPWMIANPSVIQFSLGVTLVGVAVVLVGAFTTPILVGVGSVFFVVAMLIRNFAPRCSGLELWNDFLVLGKVSEFASDSDFTNTTSSPPQARTEPLEIQYER